jgi:hypothetical protein
MYLPDFPVLFTGPLYRRIVGRMGGATFRGSVIGQTAPISAGRSPEFFRKSVQLVWLKVWLVYLWLDPLSGCQDSLSALAPYCCINTNTAISCIGNTPRPRYGKYPTMVVPPCVGSRHRGKQLSPNRNIDDVYRRYTKSQYGTMPSVRTDKLPAMQLPSARREDTLLGCSKLRNLIRLESPAACRKAPNAGSLSAGLRKVPESNKSINRGSPHFGYG